MTPSTPAAVATGSPGPRAASGRASAKPSLPTSARLSAAVTSTSCAAATGIDTSHAHDVARSAAGTLRVALYDRPPVSAAASDHDTVSVAVKDTNSNQRSGLKLSGANQPGKVGDMTMLAICL
jgi:hypothetical protein